VLKISEFDSDIVLDVYEPATRIVLTGRSERYTRVERSANPHRALFVEA
jgi:hypothetical protein